MTTKKPSFSVSGLINRAGNILRRSWTQDFLAKKTEGSDRYSYCLMGGVLRAYGIEPVQLDPAHPLRKKLNEIRRSDPYSSREYKKLESRIGPMVGGFNEFPPEARLALETLAEQILMDYPDDMYSFLAEYGYVEEEYMTGKRTPYPTRKEIKAIFARYPLFVEDVITFFNDEVATKKDIKALFSNFA
jgi:hypothetical protein